MKKETVQLAERAKVETVFNTASAEVYLPPCQIACPLGTDIQRSNVWLANVSSDPEEFLKEITSIGDEIYEKSPMFPVCGYICGLCEKECNYKNETGSVRRRLLERFIGDHYLAYLETKPAFPTPTKEKVAIVGGGPGGLVCAYMLGKKGYRVTIFEKGNKLGGAIRWIPRYRLPQSLLDRTINNLIRVANIDVKYGVNIGDEDKTLEDLKKQGYRAIFIATGRPLPRVLVYDWKPLHGLRSDGIINGLDLLDGANEGKYSLNHYEGKKVIVVGGGNVAFDVARTARRLGGEVVIVCLERSDKSHKDGIPADIEEIEGAEQEGIEIEYSRAVQEIITEDGKFKKIKSPKCVSLFDSENRFNPEYDRDDFIYIEGDVLLIAIGQVVDYDLFKQAALLDDKERMDVDQITLMSNLQEGVFIGGDVVRIGFAAESMRDGVKAAESIERYIRGKDLKAGRDLGYERAVIPQSHVYKPQPELVWELAEKRLNFELFEKGFTLEQAMEEAKRCLYCGPCQSCKACVVLGFQPEIVDIEVNLDTCGRCGICVSLCPYGAPQLMQLDGERNLDIDTPRCKRCGICVAGCPAGAITVKDDIMATINGILDSLSE